jgi:hypothetical protein
VLKDVGAAYLIDDQLKHCLAAHDMGVQALLFGNYAWNQASDLPDGIVRCAGWADVADYFDDFG